MLALLVFVLGFALDIVAIVSTWFVSDCRPIAYMGTMCSGRVYFQGSVVRLRH